jgi:hypothetical protein
VVVPPAGSDEDFTPTEAIPAHLVIGRDVVQDVFDLVCDVPQIRSIGIQAVEVSAGLASQTLNAGHGLADVPQRGPQMQQQCSCVVWIGYRHR